MARVTFCVATFGFLVLLYLTSSVVADNATDAANINSTIEPDTQPKPTLKPLSPETTPQDGFSANAASLKDCTIATNNDIPLKIKEVINGGASLIKYHIHINESDLIFEGKNSSLMYEPLYWVRSTSRKGTGLLLLKPNYDRLSLNTLEIGVQTMTVNVTQQPDHCLLHLNGIDIENLFRTLVMNDFQNTSSGAIVKLKSTENVCNLHLTNNSGTANFQYICCQRNEYDEIHCNYLQRDLWLNVLFFVITLIEVVVVLFSPKLVPDVYYRAKHVAAPYIHRLQPGQKMSLNIITTLDPDRFPNANVRIKLSKLRMMEKFKKYIASMKIDEPRRIILEKVNLLIKHYRLLPENYAPVGLLTTIYESIFKCNIRKRASLQDCCDADVLARIPCGKTCSWYMVFRGLMRIIMLMLLATPWIIRVYAYYMWEQDEINLRKEAAHARQLHFSFPGSVTLLLSPLHILFLFIYCFLTLESCAYGVLGRKVRERLKMVLRQCFRDMREMGKMEVVGWAVKNLIKPCTYLGAFGFCLGFVFWIPVLPVVLVILACYLLPTLNITILLLAHFVVYLFPTECCSKLGCFKRVGDLIRRLEINLELEKISKQGSLEKKMLNTFSSRFQQLVVIFMCLISMYSIIFLILEFISFIVDVCVYTMMGVILNAGTVYTYISLLVLLALYANECFGNVSGKFLAFNQKMHDVVLGLVKEKVEKTIYSNEENFAFRVKTDHSSELEEPIILKKNSEGFLRWNIKRLCLFLNNNDQPMIPTTFYFNACHMPFYLAPGELMVSYMKATMEFGAIAVFLIFFLVVVMAFSDTYAISATNKLLATVTGGLLPLMLRRVIFKSHSVPSIDASNIYFKTCFNDLVETYEEDWPIYDFDITSDESNLVHDVTSDTNESNNEATVELNGKDENDGNVTEHGNQIDLVIDVRYFDPDEFPDMDSSLKRIGDPSNVRSFSTGEDTLDTALNIELLEEN